MDGETLKLVIVNLPNFVGLVLAVYVLNSRMVAFEDLLRNVLERCIHDHEK
jgi:hypothetical protein